MYGIRDKIYLRKNFQEKNQSFFNFWKCSKNDDTRKYAATIRSNADRSQNTPFEDHSLEFRGSDFNSRSVLIRSQGGFALTLLISMLPLILSALFFFLFTSFLVKNWMQSAHICRSTLLETQNQVGKELDKLMSQNLPAKSLRLRLAAAKIELAAAIASENPVWISAVELKIQQIQIQRIRLDHFQKMIILKANLQMARGSQRVVQKLRQQDFENQKRLPSFFSFSIRPQIPVYKTVAIRPDLPDIAPVYELLPGFEDQQSLSISWISEFSAGRRGESWIHSVHQKKDLCGATLRPAQNHFFKETLYRVKQW